jgi:hypothetical protein
MRALISSTVIDFQDIRDEVARYLDSIGVQSIASEQGSLTVPPNTHSYQACIQAVEKADIVICFIGSRYGGTLPSPDDDISITRAEVREAFRLNKHVLTFVRQNVWDAKEILKAYSDFKPNKIVSDVRIFDFIDEIRRRSTGNWIFTFYDAGRVIETLKNQLQQFGISEFIKNCTGIRSVPIQNLSDQQISLARHCGVPEKSYVWMLKISNPGLRKKDVTVLAEFDRDPSGHGFTSSSSMMYFPAGQKRLMGNRYQFKLQLQSEEMYWIVVYHMESFSALSWHVLPL